ncbi:MAG TPA: glycosyltransferase family 4 protein [Nannocystaceae bacterium]|nr:glycosyltransferase family 4 protein [Nannocystaceae bacterium]
MRIAQVAPLYESVPPKLYGGTERVVSFLTEALVRQGHDVTLFASGDSVTAAKLVPCCDDALRLSHHGDPLAVHMRMLAQVHALADRFDVIHWHVDYLHYPSSRHLEVPQLTTLHGRLDLAGLPALYDEFADMPVVSISDAQRKPLPQACWLGTVHHGLPRDLLPFVAEPGDYLAFVGRVSPEKRVDRAIEIARRVGMPLRIAAKIETSDIDYYHAEIAPLLDGPGVEFVGEIDELGKRELLGRARAMLFPIDWPEPFGLVMIEAMSCGTPVIAWDCGSVREVIDDGVSGFVVSDLDAAVVATRRVAELDRKAVRACFERRFTAERMAADYVEIYEQLVRGADVARIEAARASA